MKSVMPCAGATRIESNGVRGVQVRFVAKGCDDIVGVKFEDGRVLYQFELSDADRAAIAAGADVSLWIWTGESGRPQPVGLQVVGVQS